MTIPLKAVSGVAQTSCHGLVCIPITMPDPADSQCPVWSGNGNVVSCCRSSSGLPLSADCGGRTAPGESSSDVSSLVQSSLSSLGERLSAEPSTTTAEKIRRSSETFSTIWCCSVLACIKPYILCEGTNGLLELFGKFKIVDNLLVLPYSFLQHYQTSVIPISQNCST